MGSMLCLEAFESRLFVNIMTLPCAEDCFQLSHSSKYDCIDFSNLTLSSPCEALQVDETAMIGEIPRTRIQYYSYYDQSGLEGMYVCMYMYV